MSPPDPQRRRLSLARSLAFSAVVLLLLAVALELALRLGAALVGEPPRRTGEAVELEPARDDALRILAVGDSWVYGAESPPEAAFVQVFARAVEHELGRPVQVYNLGVPASNSAQALLALDAALPVARPHLAVALTGANDALHDTGVAEAARLMGREPIVGPPWERLRLVRLARLLALNLGSRGTAQADAPPPVIEPPPLPWWDLFLRRRWGQLDAALAELLPQASGQVRGALLAWEALADASGATPEHAPRLAAEALELGGDDAVAWEALARWSERRGEGELALMHRVRAASAPGHPWVRALARGRALVELERWDAGQRWLLACLDAAPANLEAQVGLAAVPPAARRPRVAEELALRPGGHVRPLELADFQLGSELSFEGGDPRRVLEALGPEVEDEPPANLVARGRAALVAGDLAAARDYFERARAAGARGTTGQLAAAGLVAVGAVDPGLDGDGSALLLIARVATLGRQGRCDEVLPLAARAIAAGARVTRVERDLASCVPHDVGQALGELAWSRGPWAARARLLGLDEAPAAAADTSVLPLGPAGHGCPESLAACFGPSLGGDEPAAARAARGDVVGALLDDARRAAAGDTLARARGAARAGAAGAQRLLLAALAEHPGRPELVALLAGLRGPNPSLAVRRQLQRGPRGDALWWVRRFVDDDRRDAARLAARWPGLGGPTARALAQAWIEDDAASWRVALDSSGGADAVSCLAARRLVELGEVVEMERRCGSDPRALEPQLERAVGAGDCAGALAVGRRAWGLGLRPERLARSLGSCLDEDTLSGWIRERVGAAGLGAEARRLALDWLDAARRPAQLPAGDPQGSGSPHQRSIDHLRWMSARAEQAGVPLVVLTYPFPGAHHAAWREALLASSGGLDVLDLYGHFEQRFDAQAWQRMRTPYDHVDADGYREMGEELFRYARRTGLIPGAGSD